MPRCEPTELLILVALVVVVFALRNLPEVGGMLGRRFNGGVPPTAAA
ncbi:MAG: hypothetical protein IT307_16700 [Chloroflexi bacterium]|nr:hypothetical protein [Chloroflexota bacterium]